MNSHEWIYEFFFGDRRWDCGFVGFSLELRPFDFICNRSVVRLNVISELEVLE